jgi:effector-binding domain-containing protein
MDRNRMRLLFIGSIIFPLLSGCSIFGVNSVEEASYDVLMTDGKFELRKYDTIVVAETYFEGEFEEAGNRAFRKLFNYISGDNSTASAISMTAPVIVNESTSDDGTKIPMTTPVLRKQQDQGWRYMFVLPSKYSYETAPVPSQEDVKLSVLPQKRAAVLRFTGTMDQQLMEQKTFKLNQWMAENNLAATSSPRWAQYNPPWTLPFLRRNEVIIDVN